MGKVTIGAIGVVGWDDITGLQMKIAGEQGVAPGRHITGGLTVDQATVGKFEGTTERAVGKLSSPIPVMTRAIISSQPMNAASGDAQQEVSTVAQQHYQQRGCRGCYARFCFT